MAMTTQDVAIVSFRVGQVTLPISVLTSSRNSLVLSITLGPRKHPSKMAGQEGFEPPTPGFGDRCSSR